MAGGGRCQTAAEASAEAAPSLVDQLRDALVAVVREAGDAAVDFGMLKVSEHGVIACSYRGMPSRGGHARGHDTKCIATKVTFVAPVRAPL